MSRDRKQKELENNPKQEDRLTTDQIIALMDIYQSEWQHRDDTLWSQAFRLFYANLLIIVLPNIAEFVGIELPPVDNRVFPVVGILMSLVFLRTGIGYALRLRASGQTYQRMMQYLKKEYRRKSIDEVSKVGKLFSGELGTYLVISMFIALIVLAVCMLVVS